MIRTGDNDRTAEILKGMGICGTEREPDGSLRVNERIEETAAMAKAIVNAGIDLDEIALRTISLEDYYLGVTGGPENE